MPTVLSPAAFAPVPIAIELVPRAFVLSPIAIPPSFSACALIPFLIGAPKASVGIITPVNITASAVAPTILENTTDKEERFVMFFAVSATTT